MNIKKIQSFSEIQHLCLLRLSAIGDILNLLPSIDFVLTQYQHLHLTWIIGTGEASLFKYFAQRFGGRVTIVTFDKKMSYLQAFKLLRNLNEGKPFDMLLHAQTSMRSNFLALMIKAHFKVGFSKERSFEGHGFVVDYQIPTQESMHVLLDHWDQFKPFVSSDLNEKFTANFPDTSLLYKHGENDDKSLINTLINSQSYRYEQQHNLQPVIELGIDSGILQGELKEIYQHLRAKQQEGCEVILFNIASSALKKNWTITGYQELLQYLIDKGFYILITGSRNPTELALISQVLANVVTDKANISTNKNNVTTYKAKDYIINLAGKTNLAELVVFTQLCDLAISPDSGPMHLASLLGKPTLGLFAYINPMRSGPYQSAKFVVSCFHQQMYGFDNQFTEKQLQQDLKNWRRKPSSSNELMNYIVIEDVISAFERLYDNYKQKN